MSLSNVYEKLEKLASTDSTNDKISLLKTYLQDNLFLKVVQYALNGDMMYQIKAFPAFKPRKGNLMLDKSLPELESLFAFLKKLAAQSGTNSSEKQTLFEMASIDAETYEVVKRICLKDLKCGVSAKSINKAIPHSVVGPPAYMRCSTETKIDNIIYPAIIQEKADGMFVNVMINKKAQIKFVTRNGKTVKQLTKLKNTILNGSKQKIKYAPKTGILNSSSKDNFVNRVYTGELLVMKKEKILERKTGNGILNSCLHGTASQEDVDCVVLRIWDTLPLEAFRKGFCNIAYNTRIFQCSTFVDAIKTPNIVDTVMLKRVESYEEAHEFYAKMRKEGKEGAILKNLTLIWKNHTSVNQIKMKNVSECELKIVGWEYGKEDSKYKMCMGALICESACGKLKVNIGGGFSDEEREADWDMAIDEIITAEFESVIQDKRNKDSYSLYQGRFKDVRADRSVADTLEEILERE